MVDHPHNSEPSRDSDEESVRQISKRKVVYVEIDEEITSIFERIERLPDKDVFLVIPERAVLLQSVVNLQILKKKVTDARKSLSLVTNDPVGIQLAHQADIPVFDQYKPTSTPSTERSDEDDQEGTLKPMTALSNDVPDERPQRLTQKKLSIFEVVREAKGKRSFSLKSMKRFFQARKEKELFKDPSRFSMGGPSKKTLATLVLASLSVLLIISYVALPGATVTVTPQSNVIEQSANITLANSTVYGTNPTIEGGHVLVSYPISITIEKNMTYPSTGQLFKGTNASGVVTLINERSTPWTLVALTRLQTEDGLIFRTQEVVTVPAATTQGFGSTEVPVLADELDVYGRVIGERGNLGPSSFFLPGLREDSQKMLYARSSAGMTGGSTVVTLQVTQEDLDASAELLRDQLESAAQAELEAEIERRNTTNSTHLTLLTGYGAITLGEPSLSIPTSLVDALQDEFQVSGRLTVSGYAFDHDEFITVMQQELETRKSPDKELLKVDESSISYELFEINETAGVIKFTATIKGIEAYALDPENENGAKLIKKIKEHIAGKSIKEAEDYIQNLSEINKVTISTWPVWAPTIPTVLENIEIRVDEEWEASMMDDVVPE